MGSLQDQLLKTGMVNKKQVKKAAHDKRVEQTKNKKGQGSNADAEAKARLKKQREEQAAADRQRNIERQQQDKLKADQAAAKQLIANHHQPPPEGDEPYNYVDGKRIKRFYSTKEIADKLEAGKIALASHQDKLVLIPVDTALKVMERDEQAVLIYNDPANAVDYPEDW